MEFPYIAALMGIGAVAGTLGSMLGLGGAFMMTPVQYIIYQKMGLPPDLALLTSFSTSLFAVLPTAISGAWRHHRNEVVVWQAALFMGVISAAAGYAGATLATVLPGDVLSMAFGIVLILAGLRMVFSKVHEEKTEMISKPWLWALWAIPIGLVSGTFGIGGGVVTVPILVLALKFHIRQAIGTSMAIIILTSVGGTIGYIVNGLGVPGRLDYSIGYINLTAWLLLVVPSAAMAQVGAALSHRIPHKPLVWVFFAILLFLSLKMMGVLALLGWSF